CRCGSPIGRPAALPSCFNRPVSGTSAGLEAKRHAAVVPAQPVRSKRCNLGGRSRIWMTAEPNLGGTRARQRRPALQPVVLLLSASKLGELAGIIQGAESERDEPAERIVVGRREVSTIGPG